MARVGAPYTSVSTPLPFLRTQTAAYSSLRITRRPFSESMSNRAPGSQLAGSGKFGEAWTHSLVISASES
jgi:hypothetical protein